MRYQKGTFVVIPNIEFLIGKPSEMQAIYFWLCKHANDDGVCFPTKKKISEESGCSHNTVDKYLKQLVEDGFLSITARKKSGSKENTSNYYQLQILGTPPTNSGMTCPPNSGSETISNINYNKLTINSESEDSIKPKVITIGQLPLERGRTYINRILSINADLFKDKYGYLPVVDIKRMGGRIKELAQTRTELQIAALLIVFFEWCGMSGEDIFERDKLIKASHPLGWFFSSVNQYETFLRNVWGLDMDNEDKVREFVAVHMRKLSTCK